DSCVFGSWYGLRGVSRSFPTRRSSDLGDVQGDPAAAGVAEAQLPGQGLQAHQGVFDRGVSAEAAGQGFLAAAGQAKHPGMTGEGDRKSTRLNSSHVKISYAVFCLKKKK